MPYWNAKARIQALYELRAERCELTVIQALLPVSYRYDILHQFEDVRHWYYTIWTHIQRVGLHHESTYDMKDTKTRQLYRRFWWAFIVRGRQISLAACTRPTVTMINIPVLELHEISLVNYPASIARALDMKPARKNYYLQKQLNNLNLGQIKLYIILDNILTHLSERTGIRLQQLSKEQVSREAEDAEWCYWQLQEWYDRYLRPALLHHYQMGRTTPLWATTDLYSRLSSTLRSC